MKIIGTLGHVWMIGTLAALALGGASPADAATRSEVVNGATCIPYPAFNASTAMPYQHWLYGFGQRAYCHLSMVNDWPVTQLSYVLFSGSVSAGVMTARLCVHSGDFAVSCGASKTLTPSGSVNWVAPPSPLPSYPSGAFVQFDFPSGNVSTVRQLIPVWNH